MGKLNVAIADDNERMLRLLGDIIRTDDELEVVGTARAVSYTHLTLPTILLV